MGASLGALFIRLEVIADTEIHAPRLFNFSAGGVLVNEPLFLNQCKLASPLIVADAPDSFVNVKRLSSEPRLPALSVPLLVKEEADIFPPISNLPSFTSPSTLKSLVAEIDPVDLLLICFVTTNESIPSTVPLLLNHPF